MKKYEYSLRFNKEIIADSEEEAYDKFCEFIKVSDWVDCIELGYEEEIENEDE